MKYFKCCCAGLVIFITIFSCFPRDTLYTVEPDAFYTGRILKEGQFQIESRFSLTQYPVDLLCDSCSGIGLPPLGLCYGGIGIGLSKKQEVLFGLGEIGEHCSPRIKGKINAFELRWRKQVLEKGVSNLFHIGLGAGADILFFNLFKKYYGYRVLAQFGIGLASKTGFGHGLPITINYTNLQVKRGEGFSFTPGVNYGYDGNRFSFKFGFNFPLGNFFSREFKEGDTLFYRDMFPFWGFRTAVRF